MTSRIELQEDEQGQKARLQNTVRESRQIMRTTFIATPLLVGCLYLLLRHIPRDAFEEDFWLSAFVFPILANSVLCVATYLICRYSTRRCILSASGIGFTGPQGRLFPWRALDQWRIETASDDPTHFTLAVKRKWEARWTRILLPGTYSIEEIERFIKSHTIR